MDSIADIRKDYKLRSLTEADVDNNAIIQFGKWWNEAIESKIDEVNAMTLATVNASCIPSARIVLLKGYNENGFIFFTNYNSHKGNDLSSNNNAALLFFWKELERQVRIEGTVTKLDEPASDEYFASRPAGSQLGAWASPQSSIITSRETIEANMAELEKSFEGKKVDRPPHWGGYIVKPNLVEFWQGRSNRLHDRIQYTLKEKGWEIKRLAP